MIVQVNAELYMSKRVGMNFGFYRLMIISPGHPSGCPAYWMFNGRWHHRSYPDLNPPASWEFEAW